MNNALTGNTSRIESLQSLRALAFLGIFFYHTGIKWFASFGAWGVSVFFVMSGFLMVYSYYPDKINLHSIKDDVCFGIRKIRKLYFLHIITMIAAIPFLFNNEKTYGVTTRLLILFGKMFFNVFLIQSWVPDSRVYYSLNGVSWYLSVLLFLYIVFPAVLNIMKKYNSRKKAMLFLVFGLLMQIVMAYIVNDLQDKTIIENRFDKWYIYIFPVSRFADFFVGCNLGYVFLKTDFSKVNDYIFTGLEIITISLIAMTLYFNLHIVLLPVIDGSREEIYYWWSDTVIYTLSSCAIVLLFSINKGYLSKILTNSYLVFLGDLSACAFLIHQIVIRYIAFIFGSLEDKGFIFCIIALFITITFSAWWRRIDISSNIYNHVLSDRR